MRDKINSILSLAIKVVAFMAGLAIAAYYISKFINQL